MPIINPIYFYLMEVGIGFKIIFTILSAILFTAFVISGVSYLSKLEDGYGREVERLGKVLKKVMLFTVLFTTFAILIPSPNTVMKIIIAENITSENYQFAKDEITELIDYISEKIKQE